MNNRDIFRKILEEHDLTQAAAAALICEQTQRSCSVRAVRSWVNDPNAPSARPCQDWAVKALINALAAKGVSVKAA